MLTRIMLALYLFAPSWAQAQTIPPALDVTAAEVKAFIDRVVLQDKFKRGAEDYEKEGIFTGAHCVNPMTGALMPVYGHA